MLHRYPHELSGGERQRVALAKAIVREPAVFLLDEPLSNLDTPLRNELRGELKQLHSRTPRTMVYVTHDQEEALALADRVAVLNRGRLQQLGRPEDVFHRPANRFVAGFIGRPAMNFFPGVLRRPESAGTALQFATEHWAIPIDPPAGGRLLAQLNKTVVMGLRPGDIHLRPLPGVQAPAVMEGTVRLVEPLGAETVVYVTRGATRNEAHPQGPAGEPAGIPGDVVCQTRLPAQWRPGQHTGLWFDMGKSYWFDGENGGNLCSPETPSTAERPAA